MTANSELSLSQLYLLAWLMDLTQNERGIEGKPAALTLLPLIDLANKSFSTELQSYTI